MSNRPLLDVRDLRTHFETPAGTVRAVDGISFFVGRGETVCLVGESGCGKTVTAESVTRLFDSPPGRIVGGSIEFDGREITDLDEAELRAIRGGRIGHVFQNPQGSLNPVYPVGWQIIESIALHRGASQGEARAMAIDLLDRVGIPDPAARVDDYPHEFSDGMKQRIAIAIAIAGRPDLLIADEPTTALDVTIQAQILRLFADLQAEYGMAILFITHDLGVVAEVADRVVVMYGGKVMERAGVEDLFDRPGHPYTRALLECLPERSRSATGIPGRVPDPIDPPAGCRFHPRCRFAIGTCATGEQPPLHPVSGDDHVASCIYHGPGYDASVLDREGVDGPEEGEPIEPTLRSADGDRE